MKGDEKLTSGTAPASRIPPEEAVAHLGKPSSNLPTSYLNLYMPYQRVYLCYTTALLPWCIQFNAVRDF